MILLNILYTILAFILHKLTKVYIQDVIIINNAVTNIELRK